MEILPAIDLREGKCVRLLQGDYNRQIDYRDDPVSKAYQKLFDSEEFRTCKKCGTVMPKP